LEAFELEEVEADDDEDEPQPDVMPIIVTRQARANIRVNDRRDLHPNSPKKNSPAIATPAREAFKGKVVCSLLLLNVEVVRPIFRFPPPPPLIEELEQADELVSMVIVAVTALVPETVALESE
jgi:hypothetical protein